VKCDGCNTEMFGKEWSGRVVSVAFGPVFFRRHASWRHDDEERRDPYVPERTRLHLCVPCAERLVPELVKRLKLAVQL
jgi:hypothetical protein